MFWNMLPGFFVSALLVSGVVGVPARVRHRQENSCTTPNERRAWHTLSDQEKADYISAEVCLMNQPARTGLPGTRTLFDDLISVHQVQGNNVHWDGWFLPFHRLHMLAHEKLLRDVCGYQGFQPYWDEARDAGKFSSSVVFDPLLGFGGNGVEWGYGQDVWDFCIRDGPFENYMLHTGPGLDNTRHCITRLINDEASMLASQDEIDICQAMEEFADAWPCIEGNPHRGGHGGVGGEMSDRYSSPGDPLFYLHHTFLDRVWWQWQEKRLPDRLYDIAGYTTGDQPLSGWVNATLGDTIDMMQLIPNASIADIMDTRNSLLCYVYT